MERWKCVYRRAPWLLLLPLGLLWPTVCAGREALVERVYSAQIYPVIKKALAAVTSCVPFSLAECVLYALIMICAALLIGHIVRLVRRREHAARFVAFLLSLAILFGALLNWFYLSWGLNYFRMPLAARMGLSVTARPAAELEALCTELATEANTLRRIVPEDENGVFRLRDGLQPMLDALTAAYETAGESYPALAGGATRAKRVLLSEGLSAMGIAGIYIGMTAEPNVNAHQPALLIPQGAAHEMAHQLGLASEDEAEFAAFLVCCGSDDVCVRYSGIVNAMVSCVNALKKADPEAYARVRSLYGEELRLDLADYDRYWDAYDGALNEIQTEMNDAYLKHNAQQSGVASYGESVDLLLAWRAQTKS